MERSAFNTFGSSRTTRDKVDSRLSLSTLDRKVVASESASDRGLSSTDVGSFKETEPRKRVGSVRNDISSLLKRAAYIRSMRSSTSANKPESQDVSISDIEAPKEFDNIFSESQSEKEDFYTFAVRDD